MRTISLHSAPCVDAVRSYCLTSAVPRPPIGITWPDAPSNLTILPSEWAPIVGTYANPVGRQCCSFHDALDYKPVIVHELS